MELEELVLRPAPLRSTPLHSASLRSTPLHSAPLRSTPLHSAPLRSTPLHSAPLRSIPLHSAPLNYFSPPGSVFDSESNSDSETVASSTALFFAPSKLMLDCYHHRQDTLTSGCRVSHSQRSRTGRVAINCTTVFCLLVTDFLISSNPASPIAFAKGGYSQLPYPRLCGCLPGIHSATLCRKLSRDCSILGVSTHVSAPNRSTTCATAL